jgi:hypothetical protein
MVGQLPVTHCSVRGATLGFGEAIKPLDLLADTAFHLCDLFTCAIGTPEPGFCVKPTRVNVTTGNGVHQLLLLDF